MTSSLGNFLSSLVAGGLVVLGIGVALIIFLARYYNKIPSEYVSNIKYIFLPIFAISIPVFLVAAQPDLGTALIISFVFENREIISIDITI